MHQLAKELYQKLELHSPDTLSFLSDLGKHIFFPKGILTQAAEANEKAKKFNATLGIATENGGPMYLDCVHENTSLSPQEVYPYAPVTGLPQLRKIWKEYQQEKNPAFKQKKVTSPIVTVGITHGLSLCADLFMDQGDTLLLPDKFWGNYNLIFAVRRNAKTETYNTFTKHGLDLHSFQTTLQKLSQTQKKILILMNFPNNPSGYQPTFDEVKEIGNILKSTAQTGTKLVIICDEAYAGLYYEPHCYPESVFGYINGLHQNILPVLLNGATKEFYVWGLRVAFISFGLEGFKNAEVIEEVLENKIKGLIRAQVSSGPKISQSMIVKAMSHLSLASQKAEKQELLASRYFEVKKEALKENYHSLWEAYPFNSGYFMCLKMKHANAHNLRTYLLDKYQLGIVSLNDTDIRIAFSSLEVSQISEVFSTIAKAAVELQQK